MSDDAVVLIMFICDHLSNDRCRLRLDVLRRRRGFVDGREADGSGGSGVRRRWSGAVVVRVNDIPLHFSALLLLLLMVKMMMMMMNGRRILVHIVADNNSTNT